MFLTQFLNRIDIKGVIQFIVYSNTWIGLGAAAIAWQTTFLLAIEPDFFLIAFIFFGTKLTYSFQRFAKIVKGGGISGDRMNWMIEHQRLVILFLIVDFIGAGYFLYSTHFANYIYTLLPAGIISFFYAWKVPGLAHNLRDIPGVKIFLISVVWAYLVTYLPALNASDLIKEDVHIAAVANFFLILALTVPFDIRDIYLDEPQKRTIPQLTGITFSKFVAVIFCLISFALFTYIAQQVNPGLAIATVVTVILILKSKPENNDLFFSLYIDGILILEPILYLLTIWSTIYIQ